MDVYYGDLPSFSDMTPETVQCDIPEFSDIQFHFSLRVPRFDDIYAGTGVEMYRPWSSMSVDGIAEQQRGSLAKFVRLLAVIKGHIEKDWVDLYFAKTKPHFQNGKTLFSRGFSSPTYLFLVDNETLEDALVEVIRDTITAYHCLKTTDRSLNPSGDYQQADHKVVEEPDDPYERVFNRMAREFPAETIDFLKATIPRESLDYESTPLDSMLSDKKPPTFENEDDLSVSIAPEYKIEKREENKRNRSKGNERLPTGVNIFTGEKFDRMERLEEMIEQGEDHPVFQRLNELEEELENQDDDEPVPDLSEEIEAFEDDNSS